jgi:hypothetical protein
LESVFICVYPWPRSFFSNLLRGKPGTGTKFRKSGEIRASLRFAACTGIEALMLFGPKGPFCQSCGMPLSKDEHGGTEADGSKSAEYCSHCYVKGQFTWPDMTADQMVELVNGKLKEMHVPGFVAKSLTKDIPKLKRWKSGPSA